MVIGDISWLPKCHLPELILGYHVREKLAELRDRRILAAAGRLERAIAFQNATKQVNDDWGTHHVDGLGQKILCIGRDFLDELRRVHGAACLQDPDFRKYLLKNFPALRVKSIPAKVTIRVNGQAASGRLELPESRTEIRGNNGGRSSVRSPDRGDPTGSNAPVISGMKKPRIYLR